jgi:hypothetical protein
MAFRHLSSLRIEMMQNPLLILPSIVLVECPNEDVAMEAPAAQVWGSSHRLLPSSGSSAGMVGEPTTSITKAANPARSLPPTKTGASFA